MKFRVGDVCLVYLDGLFSDMNVYEDREFLFDKEMREEYLKYDKVTIKEIDESKEIYYVEENKFSYKDNNFIKLFVENGIDYHEQATKIYDKVMTKKELDNSASSIMASVHQKIIDGAHNGRYSVRIDFDDNLHSTYANIVIPQLLREGFNAYLCYEYRRYSYIEVYF